MKNKKGVIHWDAMLLGFLIGVGMIVFSGIVTPNIPTVGQYSATMLQAFEKNSNTYLITEVIMRQIARESISRIGSDVFVYSTCRNYAGYKLLNNENNEICANKNLEQYFNTAFTEEYNKFKSTEFKNPELDFSNVDYGISIEKENDIFFIIGETEDRLEVPVNLINYAGKKGEQIGKIFFNASFRITLDFDFDEYSILVESIEKAIQNCDEESCVKRYLKDNNFEPQECETGDERTFYGFLEYFDECVNSESRVCACVYNVEEDFDVIHEDDKIRIRAKINGEEFETELGNANLARDKLDVDKGEFLYRDGEGKISVSNEEGDRCSLKKTKFRFCVKSNVNQYYDYDGETKKPVLKDVVYRFALQFD